MNFISLIILQAQVALNYQEYSIIGLLIVAIIYLVRKLDVREKVNDDMAAEVIKLATLWESKSEANEENQVKILDALKELKELCRR